jgi:hypothetical protein
MRPANLDPINHHQDERIQQDHARLAVGQVPIVGSRIMKQ